MPGSQFGVLCSERGGLSSVQHAYLTIPSITMMIGFCGSLEHYLMHIISSQFTLVVTIRTKYWFLRLSTLSLDSSGCLSLFLWDGLCLLMNRSSVPACDPMVMFLLPSKALPVVLFWEIDNKMHLSPKFSISLCTCVCWYWSFHHLLSGGRIYFPIIWVWAGFQTQLFVFLLFSGNFAITVWTSPGNSAG